MHSRRVPDALRMGCKNTFWATLPSLRVLSTANIHTRAVLFTTGFMFLYNTTILFIMWAGIQNQFLAVNNGW